MLSLLILTITAHAMIVTAAASLASRPYNANSASRF